MKKNKMVKSIKIQNFFLVLLFVSGCVTTTDSTPARDPKTAAKLYLELGITYLQRKRYDLAETKLQRSISNEPTAEAYNALALVYEETHNNILAETTYKKLIAEFPSYARGYLNYNIFLCKYDRRGQINALAQTMATQGKNIAAVGQVAAGDCAKSKGDEASAERHYKQALQFEPYSAEALLPLAEMNVRRGFIEKAKQQVDTVNNHIGYSSLSVYLSILINRDLGDKMGERSMTQTLLSQFPNSPEAAKIRGITGA